MLGNSINFSQHHCSSGSECTKFSLTNPLVLLAALSTMVQLRNSDFGLPIASILNVMPVTKNNNAHVYSPGSSNTRVPTKAIARDQSTGNIRGNHSVINSGSQANGQTHGRSTSHTFKQILVKSELAQRTQRAKASQGQNTNNRNHGQIQQRNDNSGNNEAGDSRTGSQAGSQRQKSQLKAASTTSSWTPLSTVDTSWYGCEARCVDDYCNEFVDCSYNCRSVTFDKYAPIQCKYDNVCICVSER